MKHRKFFRDECASGIRNEVKRYFYKWSKNDLTEQCQPMHKRLKNVMKDKLAYRQLILRSHGAETLINVILGAHGRPNKY